MTRKPNEASILNGRNTGVRHTVEVQPPEYANDVINRADLVVTGKVARGSYSVKARFWDEDVKTTNTPKVYYTLSAKLDLADITAIEGIITNHALDKQAKSKARYRPDVTYLGTHSLAPQHTQTFWIDAVPVELMLYGMNPRDFFRIYLDASMPDALRPQPARGLPTFEQALKADDLVNKELAVDLEYNEDADPDEIRSTSDRALLSLIAVLDPQKITKTENSKRSQSQSAVMDGISATDVGSFPSPGTCSSIRTNLSRHRWRIFFGSKRFEQ